VNGLENRQSKVVQDVDERFPIEHSFPFCEWATYNKSVQPICRASIMVDPAIVSDDSAILHTADKQNALAFLERCLESSSEEINVTIQTVSGVYMLERSHQTFTICPPDDELPTPHQDQSQVAS
jgi:hypothetical protein